jgi:hypothetical protein
MKELRNEGIEECVCFIMFVELRKFAILRMTLLLATLQLCKLTMLLITFDFSGL